ncbi:S8 family serine peptidase [uncultured Alistipes sp.]|uniref:S8 family peptidase n=1 Tax=uncultured Alistipes sp. TaxID=538949 RepID=UPI00351B7354
MLLRSLFFASFMLISMMGYAQRKSTITNSWGDQGGAYYNRMHNTILEQAITDAMTKGRNGLGCVVTFAAGNYPGVMDYPGNFHDDILTVGSIESNGSRSSFSGYGTKLDVVAPGNNILSTLPNNSTGSKNGTSMATPHVAGIARWSFPIIRHSLAYK